MPICRSDLKPNDDQTSLSYADMQEQLAVHKSKIDAVRAWIGNAISGKVGVLRYHLGKMWICIDISLRTTERLVFNINRFCTELATSGKVGTFRYHL